MPRSNHRQYLLASTIILILNCKTQGQIVNCTLPWECSNDEPILADTVSCYGESSCRESNRIIASWNLNCVASYSCAATNQFISGESDTTCSGFKSCINSTIQNAENANINCDGYQSCANTNMTRDYYTYRNTTIRDPFDAFGRFIFCYGSKSCANATISGTQTIIGDGYYALYGSMIYSSGIGQLFIMLRGKYAGYNLSIVCESSDTCDIMCTDNSCVNTYVFCNTTENNCDITCDNENNTCPYQYDLTSFPNISSTIKILNIDNIGNETSTNINYDNEVLSCGINSNINGTIINSNPNAINCDESEDSNCNGRNLMNNNGAICCRGFESCTNASLITTGLNATSIFCDGDGACADSIISSVGNIYCGGFQGCSYATIQSTTTYNESDESSSTSIICSSYSGCFNAKISNVTNIQCQGQYSCGASTISNVANIFISGPRAGMLADIHSSGTDVHIYLNGYIAGQYGHLYCELNDHCYIRCETYSSCLYFTVTCDGTCVFHCQDFRDDYYAICPDINGNGTWTRETTSPTQAPSLPPSTNPTAMPTGAPVTQPTDSPTAPSDAPTTAPTSVPTGNPSTAPTIFPTQNPSGSPSIAPTIAPTGSPTDSPTASPSVAPTDTSITKQLWIYYNEEIKNVLDFSIGVYAQQFVDAVEKTFVVLMNDTLLHNFCNNDQEQSSIDCNNIFENSVCNSGRRRRMFGNDYSYNLNNSNGWCQGRIDNLQICVVLWQIEWNEKECENYNEDRFEQSKEYLQYIASNVAFGTFEIVADNNIQQFKNYFQNVFNQNNATLFKSILTKIMNNKYNSSEFEAVYASIDEEIIEGEALPSTTFEDLFYLTQYIMYGFMIFCLFIALMGINHANKIKSDSIKPVRVLLFGIYTWDFISDLFFASRLYQKNYYKQFISSAVFVLIPWILNMVQLIRSQQQWTKDREIKHTMHRWLQKNNKKLMLLTGICGSVYATVEMCNSRIFGMFAFVFV